MIAGCRGSSRLRGGDIGLGWQSAAGLFSLSLAALTAGCSGGRSGATPTANPAVTISGASQARLGSTVQLLATVANTTNTAVTWQATAQALPQFDSGLSLVQADNTITTTPITMPRF